MARISSRLLGTTAALAFLATPVIAQEITLGYGTAVTSIDPHFHNLASNIKLSIHVFDRPVDQDEKMRLKPALATEWKAIDDTTWEFKLRPGVKFHDGSDFGAEDVAASIRRVAWVPNSPSPFTIYTRPIRETVVVDPLTIRFKTAAPYPLMPVDLASINIVSRKQEQAPTTAFNDGSAMIGTGPYKFTAYAPGDKMELQRNDAYWGAKPHWNKATIKIITNNASRVAALLAGDVQAIDDVPPTDYVGLKGNANVAIVRAAANSVIFMHLDSFRDQSPFVTDKAGQVLPKNPFKDVRVRQAISKAMNRQALVERIMDDTASPAGGLLAEGFFGVSTKLKPDTFDPDAAKKLLADAGYPNGFSLTIHGPNDRYPNDAKVLQAVAPMLTRIGIETKVVSQPWATFITQASTPNYAFSAILIGNSATTGEASFPLRAQVATVDAAKGMGASNRSRYSNPKVDELLGRAMTTVDDAKREALLQETAEVAMADQALVPLFYQDNIYALRKGLAYNGRADGYLAAFMIRPAN
jgi:peptide/nickel transport system substrate-binding protein